MISDAVPHHVHGQRLPVGREGDVVRRRPAAATRDPPGSRRRPATPTPGGGCRSRRPWCRPASRSRERARLMANPSPSTPIPSSSPIGEPVASSFSGSNGTASSFPSRRRHQQVPGRRVPGVHAPRDAPSARRSGASSPRSGSPTVAWFVRRVRKTIPRAPGRRTGHSAPISFRSSMSYTSSVRPARRLHAERCPSPPSK